MSSTLRFFKVNELPAAPVANAVYFVLDAGGEAVDQFITDRLANLKPVGGELFMERFTEALDLRYATPAYVGQQLAPYATKVYVDDAVEGSELDPDFIIDGGNF